MIAHIAQATGRLKPNELLFVPHTLYQMLAPLLLLDRANLPINPNLWTIAIQMRWYVVFPVLLFVWMKSPRAFGVLLGCAWIGYLFTRARTIDLGTLPLFMLGIVAADLIARRHRVVRFAVVLVPVAIVAALAWDPHARPSAERSSRTRRSRRAVRPRADDRGTPRSCNSSTGT